MIEKIVNLRIVMIKNLLIKLSLILTGRALVPLALPWGGAKSAAGRLSLAQVPGQLFFKRPVRIQEIIDERGRDDANCLVDLRYAAGIDDA